MQDCLGAHQVGISVTSQPDLIHLIAMIARAGNLRLEYVTIPKELEPQGSDIVAAASEE